MSYRIRFTLPHGSTGHWAREYATREEAQRAIDDRQKETGLAYSVEEVATPESTPEARIRELEAEVAQLRDAYDAARQDRDMAMRRLAIAEDLGDAMHRAVTNAPNYLHGPWLGPINRALEQWASHKDTITVERQGPAKASETPGEGGDSGEGVGTP